MTTRNSSFKASSPLTGMMGKMEIEERWHDELARSAVVSTTSLLDLPLDEVVLKFGVLWRSEFLGEVLAKKKKNERVCIRLRLPIPEKYGSHLARELRKTGGLSFETGPSVTIVHWIMHDTGQFRAKNSARKSAFRHSMIHGRKVGLSISCHKKGKDSVHRTHADRRSLWQPSELPVQKLLHPPGVQHPVSNFKRVKVRPHKTTPLTSKRSRCQSSYLDDLLHEGLVCAHFSLLQGWNLVTNPCDQSKLGPLAQFVAGLDPSKDVQPVFVWKKGQVVEPLVEVEHTSSNISSNARKSSSKRQSALPLQRALASLYSEPFCVQERFPSLSYSKAALSEG